MTSDSSTSGRSLSVARPVVMAESRYNQIKVLARAAKILRALEGQPHGLSLGQIARSVDLARSTVQRIVAALIAEEFLTKAGPEDVRIGPGLLRIVASIGSDLSKAIKQQLARLGEEVGETVDLSVLSGGSAVFVEQVAGRHRLAAVSAIGDRFPLHCTANGKAILACLPPAERAVSIDQSLAEHSSFRIENRSRLSEDLDEISRTNLAFDLEEHAKGICAVGTAFVDPHGHPLAVSIPVPSQRFAEKKRLLAAHLLAFRSRIKPGATG